MAIMSISWRMDFVEHMRLTINTQLFKQINYSRNSHHCILKRSRVIYCPHSKRHSHCYAPSAVYVSIISFSVPPDKDSSQTLPICV